MRIFLLVDSHGMSGEYRSMINHGLPTMYPDCLHSIFSINILPAYTHLYIFYQYLMITCLLSPACFLSKPYLSTLTYMFSINILPAYFLSIPHVSHDHLLTLTCMFSIKILPVYTHLYIFYQHSTCLHSLVYFL